MAPALTDVHTSASGTVSHLDKCDLLPVRSRAPLSDQLVGSARMKLYSRTEKPLPPLPPPMMTRSYFPEGLSCIGPMGGIVLSARRIYCLFSPDASLEGIHGPGKGVGMRSLWGMLSGAMREREGASALATPFIYLSGAMFRGAT